MLLLIKERWFPEKTSATTTATTIIMDTAMFHFYLIWAAKIVKAESRSQTRLDYAEAHPIFAF
jgi:hypothetical protein